MNKRITNFTITPNLVINNNMLHNIIGVLIICFQTNISYCIPFQKQKIQQSYNTHSCIVKLIKIKCLS